MADLSLNVNSLPTGTLFQSAGDKYLWDVYEQWLNDMVLAKDQMTADERAQYNQADALLTIKDADGFSVDSPMVVAYKQYRDAWFNANQNYKAAQSTAINSSDPAVQTQWKDIDEPRLRALVEQATSDWETKGNKAEVENARALKARLDARSPSTAWNEWSSALIRDIDLPTDPVSNMQYGPTGFSPADLFAQNWPTFRLSSDEIAQLAQSAPDELRKVSSEDTGASTITSLSFEFRSAALVRPWLSTAVFSARFWKFRDGTPPLSDGTASPQGSWPSYISGVVFARNIQITTQTAPKPQRLPWFTVSQGVLSAEVPPQATVVSEAFPQATVVCGTKETGARSVTKGILFKRDSLVGAARTPMPDKWTAVRGEQAINRLKDSIYCSPTPLSQPASASSNASPSETITTTTNNDVSILAFICRRLPQTPNPDPALNWGP
jgi:hypothetical protein